MWSVRYRAGLATLLMGLGWLGSLFLGACTPLEPSPADPNASLSPRAFASDSPLLIGGIFDLSTAEGRDYAAGALAYSRIFNAKGGVGGHKLELRATDFGGSAPVAIEEYQGLIKAGALAFLAWDEADTLALSRQINNDRVPLLSAAYDEGLVQPVKEHPYNFMIAPSYADQMKLALLYAKFNRPLPLRTPQTGVGYLYSDDNFGRFPYQIGRDYSSAHNLSWFHEGVLQPKLDPANLLNEAKRLKIANPEYTFVQAKPTLTAEMLKAMRGQELATIFLGLNYSGSANLPQLAGKAAEGYLTLAVMAYPDEQQPGLAEMRSWLAANPANSATATPIATASIASASITTSRASTTLPNFANLATPPASVGTTALSSPGPTATALAVSPPQTLTARFVQGWITMKVLAEGVRQAVRANAPAPGQQLLLNGDQIKAGLESIRSFETGGVTPLLSFSPSNHKGTDAARLYRVENGKWLPAPGYLALATLEAQDNLTLLNILGTPSR